MKTEKSNKGVIALLVVLVVVLATLCVLFATNTISIKTNEPKTNQNTTADDNKTTTEEKEEKEEVNYEEGYENYLKFKVDNEGKSDTCHNMNRNNYYSYEESYVIFVNNIKIKNKNYTFRYAVDADNKTLKVYLNNNTVFDGNNTVNLLVDVCNYGNYIVYSAGWEGPLHYTIVNTEGKIVMQFEALKLDYSNGILNVEELNRNDPRNFDDNELIKYELDMNSDNLQKVNETTEKYECDPYGAGYDC